MSDQFARARAFLGGEDLIFEEADSLWRKLQEADELSLARSVLARLRDRNGAHLLDQFPRKRKEREKLCQQEALLTSKDPELSAAVRHDQARIFEALLSLIESKQIRVSS